MHTHRPTHTYTHTCDTVGIRGPEALRSSQWAGSARDGDVQGRHRSNTPHGTDSGRSPFLALRALAPSTDGHFGVHLRVHRGSVWCRVSIGGHLGVDRESLWGRSGDSVTSRVPPCFAPRLPRWSRGDIFLSAEFPRWGARQDPRPPRRRVLLCFLRPRGLQPHSHHRRGRVIRLFLMPHGQYPSAAIVPRAPRRRRCTSTMRFGGLRPMAGWARHRRS